MVNFFRSSRSHPPRPQATRRSQRPTRRSTGKPATSQPQPPRPRKPPTGVTQPPPNPAQRPRVSLKRRLIVVWLILLMGNLGLAVNLFKLQVLQARTLLSKAKEQQMISLRPFVPRRPIVDRNGTVLASDQPIYTLYAHPKLFKAPETRETMAKRLAPLLERPEAEVLKQLREQETGIQLTQSLPEDVARTIQDWQLDGLELIQHQQRIYPQKDLAADVVGYVNSDRQGQAGVEYSQQKLLERPVQSVRVSRTGGGDVIPDELPGGFLHMDDLRLQLTIDSRMQRITRSLLKAQLKKFNAKRGAVIVMDVRNGEILTLVSEPSYDPNRYYKFDVELFKNWALTDLYEPGSTFKPINVAIALEQGAIQPNSIFNDEGRIYVSGWPIQNNDYSYVGGRGPLTLAQILGFSSNVGMVHIIQQLKPATYYSWLERLGLGQPAGIDLPFEATSRLKDRDQFIEAPIEPATTAFGQGFSLTPIQLVQLHGAIANGGKLVTPHVVKGLYDSQGQMHWQPILSQPRRIFSPKTTQAVLGMMEKVVTEGTGKVAQIPGYRLAGKTGTAQKAVNGSYSSSARITSFVSIFPVNSPRFVVLAVIDEPKGDNAFGSTTAAPVVKSVIESLITIESIPPTGPVTPPSPSPSP